MSGVDDHAGATLHRVQATGAFQRYKAFAAGEGGSGVCARLSSDHWATKTDTRSVNRGSKEEAFRNGREDSEMNGIATQERHDGTSEDMKGTCGGNSSELNCRGRCGNESQEVDDGDGNTGFIDTREEAVATKSRRERAAGEERVRFPPNYREVLKRAFLSLWDGGLDDDSSGKDSTAFAGPTREGEKATNFKHVGLRVSELSATVYGTHVSTTSECSWGGDNGMQWGGEESRGYQGLECSTSELEAILIDLDKEWSDVREKNGAGATDD